MHTSLERALARHGGPVLLGRKPAAMFPLPVSGAAHAHPARLCDGALSLNILWRRPCHELILIYRPPLLEKTLAAPDARAALIDLGYPAHGGAEALLACLRRRFQTAEDFPHEVGFFLGYPTEDVTGFIEHKGRGCKLSGPWKVYGDVARAQALFSEYEQCRTYLLAHIARGGSLQTLSPACELAISYH
ncbi:MAG: DUF3793 family protein [Oscillospiraceae bacterium]|jgi:hypothetical protein|nr:DUF3793 family protein [Oscillospiraceae bacterium]